jgi:fluoroacetyl-CoA thioesterase
MELQAGLSSRVELIVTDADTAQALGSGDVPVLGTPRLIALAEAATVAATAAYLGAGSTSVGTRVELDHQAATAVGRRVTVLATLSKVDGRRLIFDIVVRDGETQVAEGRVERVVVDRQRFVAKAFDAT